MSIASVVTGGFGSFGSVALVVTAGYSIGSILVPTSEGLEFEVGNNRLHFEVSSNKLDYSVDNNRLHYEVKK